MHAQLLDLTSCVAQLRWLHPPPKRQEIDSAYKFPPRMSVETVHTEITSNQVYNYRTTIVKQNKSRASVCVCVCVCVCAYIQREQLYSPAYLS